MMKTYPIPSQVYGPTVELYIKGFINFKPTGNSLLTGGIPYKTFPLHSYFETFKNVTTNDNHAYYGLNGIAITSTFDSSIRSVNDTQGILKKLDQKLDDGVYNTGKFRGRCLKNSTFYDYDVAKEQGIVCDLFYYDLDFKF